MNVIILGPPGSGKGTQGKEIAKRLGLYYFEAGDFSRELASMNSRIKKIIERGELIPEKDMTRYVKEYLESENVDLENVLFDGYPRFISQYEELDKYLKEKSVKVDKAIFLKVSDSVVIERLSSRRTCKVCDRVYNLITNPPKSEACECGGALVQREDDKEDVIKERLVQYKTNVKPLIDDLDEKEVLIKIDGERPIEEITKDILDKLQK